MSSLRGRDRYDSDQRGVSNALGFILLLAIVIGGTASVAILGASALSDTQQNSELERAELSMTLFDSRAAMVAIGSSDSQRIQFGQDSGHFETRPGESRLVIQHTNYTAGKTTELFNKSLGSFVYENGGTDIAYQGGGVWRLDPEGDAQMLSPPEFHFRDATLTLPIIRLGGEDSAGNPRAAGVSATRDARHVFPNETASYPGISRSYLNPLRNGTVTVQVQSDYYTAWADYFRQRTAGEVKVFDGNQTVHVTLISVKGSLGRFDMPAENQGIEVDGMGGGHPVTDFQLNLSEGLTGGGENHWAMYSTDGFNQFEVHVEPDYGSCEARVSVFYANASTGEHQEWQTDWLTSASDALSCTGSYLHLELSHDDPDIEYEDIDGVTGSGTKFCFGTTINDNSPDDPGTVGQHPVDPGNISTGHVKPLNFTINHYLSRLGANYELIVKDAQGNFCPSGAGPPGGGGSDTVDEDASYGVLRFPGAAGPEYITYLHVTENRIDVSLD
ncbi:MAG: hypothetical protein V5A18_00805 [Haloarculaceae archaeon]